MDQLAEMNKRLQDQKKDSGFFATAWLLAKHHGMGGVSAAAQEASRFDLVNRGVSRVFATAIPSADTSTAGWASELAYAGLASDWVSTVSPTTLLGKLDYVRVPFMIKAIVNTGDPSAAWVQAGEPIPISKGAFTLADALYAKKVATIIPFTAELFDSWAPATLANLRDTVNRAVRLAADYALLNPDQAATDSTPASLTNGIAMGQSTGASAAQAIADIKAMLQTLIDGGSDLSRVIIAMAPSTALHLSQLLTTGGSYAFPSLGPRGGFIWTVPVAVSKAARLLGSPAANIVAALDGERILVADDGVAEIDVSSGTTLQLSDAPATGPQNQTSLFQTHSKALRIVLHRNYQRANATAVAWFAAGY